MQRSERKGLFKMSKPVYEHKCESRYPHAADVLERQFAEDGFASGWGIHHKPVAKYFFDNHVHYCGPDKPPSGDALRPYMDVAEALNVLRTLLIIRIYGDKNSSAIPKYAKSNEDGLQWYTVESVQAVLGDLLQKSHYYWSPWIHYMQPDTGLVNAAADAGARIIKLHNAPVIEDNAHYDIWLSSKWQDVFKTIGKRGLAVLFHVTQRLPCAVYTGGGRNTYWTKGWENGVKYGNEDLLQAFLTCCRRNPDINFIGAHQLHIGWDRLDDLFTSLPNLYVDTTIGCMLRLNDDFYPHDKEYLRQMFIRWADRIVFGTDTLWGHDSQTHYESILKQHQRFITALDLPADVLEKICHSNMERLCKIHRL